MEPACWPVLAGLTLCAPGTHRSLQAGVHALLQSAPFLGGLSCTSQFGTQQAQAGPHRPGTQGRPPVRESPHPRALPRPPGWELGEHQACL